MLYLLSSFCSVIIQAQRQPAPPEKTSLTIEVHNVRTLNGAVYVALFRPGKDFPGRQTDRRQKGGCYAANGYARALSVEPGEYAIAVYHDENGNGKMDKTIFGIPKNRTDSVTISGLNCRLPNSATANSVWAMAPKRCESSLD